MPAHAWTRRCYEFSNLTHALTASIHDLLTLGDSGKISRAGVADLGRLRDSTVDLRIDGWGIFAPQIKIQSRCPEPIACYRANVTGKLANWFCNGSGVALKAIFGIPDQAEFLCQTRLASAM